MTSRKIKILHYLRHLDLGGTSKTCQLFFENAGVDFEVCLVHEYTGDKTRLSECQKARGQIREINSYRDERGMSDPQATPTGQYLQEVIDHFKPDILHVYRSGFAEFPSPGVDIDVPHFVETNVFGHIDPNPKVERTLFMSKWLMDHALKQFPPARMYPRWDFVNNPVEMPYTDEPFSHISREAIWLGRCGRPDNGIYNAVSVEAARLLRLQGYDVRFFVVAPPSNMILDLERHEIPFDVISPTTDPLVLSRFYNSIDIYAHARADGETYGVNIAEAMIHGKPVVTHIATPSFPGMGVFQAQTELVDDGETGFVVENDPAVYAEALRAIIDNQQLRESMSYYAIAKAVRECHIDACMKKLERIYREVVNGHQ